MKRKMVGVSAGYMSGLFFASFFINIYGFVMLSAAVVIVLVIARQRKFSRFDLYIIFFSFLIAFTVSVVYTINVYYGVLEFAGTTGNFSGIVTDYEVYEGDRASYILKGMINGVKKAEINLYTSELGAEYGDTITLTDCIFTGIEGDYLFDSESWYKSRHIFMRVYSAGSIGVEYNNSSVVKKSLALFRENIIEEINALIGKDSGGFLAGMIFGEKQYIDESTKTSLYRSGIGHILAVSGLHVSIIASASMHIMQKLKINRYISFVVFNFLLLVFIALADYPVSAIRATIMLDIVYSAPLFRRQSDSLNSIALAAFIICVADPYAVYSSGFILSLSGTFGIAVFAPCVNKNINNKYARIFMAGICTAFSVMPVSLYYFEETSVISPFTNILLVPLCTIAMIMGLVYIVTGGLFPFILHIADIFIKITIKLSEKISSVDFTYISCLNNFIPLLLMISGIITICVFLMTENSRFISVSIAVSIIICSAVVGFISEVRGSEMIIAVVGRGNNSAVILSYDGRTDVIDISGHYRSAEYVRKYLLCNGVSVVDSLILTTSTAAQSVIYASELNNIKINQRFAVNDVQIYGNRLELLPESGFIYDSGYIAEYYENTLVIEYSDCILNISPAKDNRHMAGLSIYYGNTNKNTHIYQNSIFLNDINNIEIVLSEGGKYKIRSL